MVGIKKQNKNFKKIQKNTKNKKKIMRLVIVCWGPYGIQQLYFLSLNVSEIYQTKKNIFDDLRDGKNYRK